MRLTLTLFLVSGLLYLSSCKKEKNSDEVDPNSITVGNKYGGGVIFYVDASGAHGLVAAEANSPVFRWNNGLDTVIGTTGIGINQGQTNTSNIISIQGSGTYAASFSDQYQLNGFSDWFLPSKEELNLLFQQKDKVGGFSEGLYWTSTEYDTTRAWNQNFPYGPQYFSLKSDSLLIRVIRAF